MSESKREAAHTPGPWFVGAQNDALYILDRRPAHDNDYPDHEADVGCIAKVYDDIRDAEIGRANAALIARAPDMAAEVEALGAEVGAKQARIDALMLEFCPDADSERLKSALTKINDIRNSIIGCQKVNWSEHVYPLVAALDAAGFEGASYEVARDQIGTLLERTNKAEAEVERLRAEHEGPDSWEANAKHLLARCPYTVRQCPGGGPEDIKSSLVVTFMGMQQDLAAERRKVEALEKNAARYRWLRGNYSGSLELAQAVQVLTPEQLDAAIDAALAAEPKP